MYLGKELTEGLKRQLEGLTLEETRLDLTTKLRLRGRLRRCQLSVQITWSARKQRHCAALLGKVTDIEDRSQCIEQLRAEIQHAETPQTLSQPTLPISASNGVIRITHHQLSHLFHTYQPLFETVRLVDPGICMQVTPGPDGPSVRENDYCYAMWCKSNAVSGVSRRMPCVPGRYKTRWSPSARICTTSSPSASRWTGPRIHWSA